MNDSFTATSSVSQQLKGKSAAWLTALVAANALVWVAAWAMFHQTPLLMSAAVLAFSLGLRHAFDADHICAIDNVTRRMIQAKKRPLGVGFYFSLGHSTIVLLLSLAVALGAARAQAYVPDLQRIGGRVGSSFSAAFLLLMAGINFVVLMQVLRGIQMRKKNATNGQSNLEETVIRLGFLGRLFRPFIRMVDQSWKMYFIGFLFGLGFDTATEVSLLGLSAASAIQGLSLWSILLFPALFTAGMCLMDTANGIFMTHVYIWSTTHPARRGSYNVVITLISVLAATIVGGVELCGIFADRVSWRGTIWSTGVQQMNEHSTTIGLSLVATFCFIWLVSIFRTTWPSQVSRGNMS